MSDPYEAALADFLATVANLTDDLPAGRRDAVRQQAAIVGRQQLRSLKQRRVAPPEFSDALSKLAGGLARELDGQKPRG